MNFNASWTRIVWKSFRFVGTSSSDIIYYSMSISESILAPHLHSSSGNWWLPNWGFRHPGSPSIRYFAMPMPRSLWTLRAARVKLVTVLLASQVVNTGDHTHNGDALLRRNADPDTRRQLVWCNARCWCEHNLNFYQFKQLRGCNHRVIMTQIKIFK